MQNIALKGKDHSLSLGLSDISQSAANQEALDTYIKSTSEDSEVALKSSLSSIINEQSFNQLLPLFKVAKSNVSPYIHIYIYIYTPLYNIHCIVSYTFIYISILLQGIPLAALGLPMDGPEAGGLIDPDGRYIHHYIHL